MKRSWLFLLLFLPQIVLCQSSLYVFKVEGDVLHNTNKAVKKGDVIGPNTRIKLGQRSGVICIDQGGNSYSNYKAGTRSYNDILRGKKKNSSVTVKYFKYVWDEFTNSRITKTTIGGTFRGQQLMLYPMDSCRIVADNITLLWNQKDEFTTSYYVFIKRKDEAEYAKFNLSDTTFSLAGNLDVQPGQEWAWVVSERAFPNLDNMPSFSFRTISEQQYNAEIKQYKALIADLKKMRLSTAAINQILCEEYGLCK